MASSVELLGPYVNCNGCRVSGNEEVMKTLTCKHFITAEVRAPGR